MIPSIECGNTNALECRPREGGYVRANCWALPLPARLFVLRRNNSTPPPLPDAIAASDLFLSPHPPLRLRLPPPLPPVIWALWFGYTVARILVTCKKDFKRGVRKIKVSSLLSRVQVGRERGGRREKEAREDGRSAGSKGSRLCCTRLTQTQRVVRATPVPATTVGSRKAVAARCTLAHVPLASLLPALPSRTRTHPHSPAPIGSLHGVVRVHHHHGRLHRRRQRHRPVHAHVPDGRCLSHHGASPCISCFSSPPPLRRSSDFAWLK